MRTRSHLLVACLLALGLAVPALAAPTVSGSLVMDFDLSAHAPEKPADLWIPYPVSDGHQVVTALVVEGDYEIAEVTTDRTFGNAMLHARWTPGSGGRSLRFSFHVAREERRIDNITDPGVPWDPADYAQWLRPTALGPVDGPVGERAAAIVAGKTGVLEKARAIYDWTVENTYRNLDTRGCGAGDVCKLLEDPGGKCADISSVYVALARAAGVPAREVLGIRQGKQDGQEITTWQHCWVEFYLPGVGWVAVDPGDVRKMMLKRGLAPGDEVPADLRAAYWGGVEPYRVRLGVGRDLTLTPAQQGGPVNYLMYPFAQVGGETLDWLDPKTFAYTITYKKDP